MKNKHRIFYLIILISGFLITGNALFVQAQDLELSGEQALKKSRQHYSEGEKFYNQGDYSRADDEFKKAQELLDQLQQEEIAIQEETGQSSPAKNKAETGGAVSYDQYLKQALEFAKSGQSEEAISYYLKAVALRANNANLHYNLALEYLKTRQFNQAAEELHKVIQLNPKDKDAYYNLGVLYESYLGDLQRAKFCYRRYIKLARRGADIKNVKGWVRQLDKEIKLEKENKKRSLIKR